MDYGSFLTWLQTCSFCSDSSNTFMSKEQGQGEPVRLESFGDDPTTENPVVERLAIM